MHKNLAKLLLNRSFLNYALIGATGVILDFLIYIGLVNINIPPFFASAISVSAGIINNFFWNARYNFKKKDNLLARFISFYCVGATGVILSVLIIVLLHNIIGISDLIAKLASVPFIVILQFWLNKHISFSDKKQDIPWRNILLTGVILSVVMLFAINASYYNFTDENDNLLGGQLIATEGAIIYKEYFSHHMPLMYFVAAPLLWLFGVNLIAVKVVFGLLMSFWLLLMGRHLIRPFGYRVFAGFTLLVSLTQMLNWSHMILAETFVAFAVVHAVILFITRSDSKNTCRRLGVLSILGCLPVLGALPYAPVSAFIYLLMAYWVFERRLYKKPLAILVILMSTILPYVIMLTYFYFTRSFGEFREQALSFNTLYYAQFTPDAPRNVTEAILSIPSASLESLKQALVNPRIHGQPLLFLASTSVILSLVILVKLRHYILASVFGLGLFLCAGRGGFTELFVNTDTARIGTAASTLAILLVTHVLYLAYRKPGSPDDTLRKSLSFTAFFLTASTFIVILVLSSGSQITKTLIDYSRGTTNVELNEEAGSPSRVINIVNSNSDTYWVGPIDFSSQLIINSQNISIYRFYAPWHAACPKCTMQLKADIRNNKPKVIALNENMAVWNIPVGTYAEDLIDSFEHDYYQLDDIRLKQFFFRIDSKEDVNKKLEEAGYEI